jgi:lipopolysaccharide export system protein LptA
MKNSSPSLRITTFLGMMLLAHSLHATPPQPVTAEETAKLQADAKSKTPEVNAANAESKARLETDLADSAAASAAVSTFLAQADLPAVPPDAEPAAKPLDVKNGPNDTIIHCTGGMYFDADAGVLVYLKNVTVNDPRYNLTGADELKIFFGKKPEEPEKEGAPEKAGDKKDSGPGGDIGAKFGDVERIVATGAVRLDQKPEPGKEAIKASGRVFTYNLKEDLILLSGGYPWFTQGDRYMRAKEPNLTLKIYPKTGSFSTEGDWEMGGNIEQKKPAP